MHEHVARVVERRVVEEELPGGLLRALDEVVDPDLVGGRARVVVDDDAVVGQAVLEVDVAAVGLEAVPEAALEGEVDLARDAHVGVVGHLGVVARFAGEVVVEREALRAEVAALNDARDVGAHLARHHGDDGLERVLERVGREGVHPGLVVAGARAAERHGVAGRVGDREDGGARGEGLQTAVAEDGAEHVAPAGKFVFGDGDDEGHDALAGREALVAPHDLLGLLAVVAEAEQRVLEEQRRARGILVARVGLEVDGEAVHLAAHEVLGERLEVEAALGERAAAGGLVDGPAVGGQLQVRQRRGGRLEVDLDRGREP